MTPTNPFPLKFVDLLWMAVVASAYVLLAKLVLGFFSANGVVSIMWPSSGLAMAAVLIGGVKYLPAVFVGAFAAYALTGMPIGVAAAIATGNAMEALLGAWLVARGGKFDPRLRTLADYLKLIGLAGFIACGVAAVSGSTVLRLSGLLAPADHAHNLLYWWLGDVLGITLITPLILAWQRAPDGWRSSRWIAEFLLMMTFLFLVNQVVFLDWFRHSSEFGKHVFQSHWQFLVIVVLGIRLQGHAVALGLVMTAAQALIGTIQGAGHFAHDVDPTRLLTFWAYTMALCAVGMVVATYHAQRTQAERLRWESENEYKLIFNTLSEGVSLNEMVFDDEMEMVDYRVLQVNDAFFKVADFKKGTPVIGQTATTLYGMDVETIKSFWKRNKDSVETFHDEMISPITQRHYSISTSPFRNNKFVTSFHDITNLKQAAAEIARLAHHDPLTRLANRLLLIDRLEQALASGTRVERTGALLFIDLDNFKGLNDTLGHGIGDLLLQQVAQRLESMLREGDTVARLGGDEFVVMLIDLSEHALEAAAQTKAIGEKILDALSKPYQLDKQAYQCTASIGVALFKGHHHSAADLMKQADIAMYQAKKAGRNALRFFDQEMQESISARTALERDLREAIRQHQFVLHYQPQVVGNGRITGVEALIRWQHPQRGMVPPSEFIPLAEETGLILPIGQWVLDTACAQLVMWAKQPEFAHLTIAVNVSAHQFQQVEFVDAMLATLKRTKATPKLLKLELTESMLVDNVDAIIAKMSALKAKGVSFSLDDFGTGYSSLAYLKRMPLDQLKIDQGFVRNIVSDPNDAAIAKMVIVLAESLGLSVIAEGVELQTQVDFLAHLGCDAYQGYLFSRPLTLAVFEAFAQSSGT